MRSSNVTLLALGLLVAFALWCMVIMWLQKSALYKGRSSLAQGLFARVHYSELNSPGSIWNTVYQYPKPGTEVVTRAELLSVESVWLRARHPETGDLLGPERPAPVVMFFHGNSSTVHNMALTGNFAQYQRNGMHVVLAEYRGYGNSAGSPSQMAITADMMDAYDLLLRCSLVDATKIVFHGFSLGGGVSGSLARWREPSAYILEGTFSSGLRVMKDAGVPGFLMSDTYKTDAMLARQCKWPTLVIHGKEDRVVPLQQHGEVLWAAARLGQERNKVPDAVKDASAFVKYDRGHYMQPHSCRYWRDVLGFLRSAGILPEDASSEPIANSSTHIPHDVEAAQMLSSSSPSSAESAAAAAAAAAAVRLGLPNAAGWMLLQSL
jgi:hypothetical protein